MRRPPSSCEQRSAWRPSVKYYNSVRIYHVTNKVINDAFVWSLSLSKCIWPWLIFCGQKWFFGELWWSSKLFCEQLLLTYSSLVQMMCSNLKCQLLQSSSTFEWVEMILSELARTPIFDQIIWREWENLRQLRMREGCVSAETSRIRYKPLFCFF